ncbi:hypothetical protein E4U61_002211 [Claviceps capensis]|nr:hypothetical protein E4U61_002211 [Claviceps capensis]
MPGKLLRLTPGDRVADRGPFDNDFAVDARGDREEERGAGVRGQYVPQPPDLFRQPRGHGIKSSTRNRGDTLPGGAPPQEGRKTFGKPQPNADSTDTDSDEAH